MSQEISGIVVEYVRAQNVGDGEALAACFTEDGVVRDEGRTHQGGVAIRAWAEEVREKYQVTQQVLEVNERDGETVARVHVSGTFPGSPIQLSFHFTFRGDRIASLKIQP